MNLSVPQLQTLVQAATLAPSSHNTQPWLFRLEGQVIELLADRTRALPVNDPDDRELTISCGCALFNLRDDTASTAGRSAGHGVMKSRRAGRVMAVTRVDGPLSWAA